MGAAVELAQLSNLNGDSPGGIFGLGPQRSATHTDVPSLSIVMALTAPQPLAFGSFPHGRSDRYGFGKSLVGLTGSVLCASAGRGAVSAINTIEKIYPKSECRTRTSRRFYR
jgi:hypothetical protein